MSKYRRNLQPGGTYFFTVNLHDRASRILVEYIDELRRAVITVRARRPFVIDSWVVPPDHLHCIWTMPEGDSDYPGRWKAIKVRFSKSVALAQPIARLDEARSERRIWQNRYWEHTIRDAQDFAAHMDYVHFNPVKHGHAERVVDWPFSTFHRLVREGMYQRDWGGQGNEPDIAGERA